MRMLCPFISASTYSLSKNTAPVASSLSRSFVDGLHQSVALCLAAAGNHKLSKHVGVLRNLERSHRSDASGANHQYS